MDPFKRFNKILELYIHKVIIRELPQKWNENHRHYHTLNHLNEVIQNIEKHSSFQFLNFYEKHALLLAAFFHDVIYDPKRKDNEDQSIKYFKAAFKNNDPKMLNVVCDLIECTKYRKMPIDILKKILWDADNKGFTMGYDTILKNEHLIRREFSHLSNDEYKKGRIDFLNSCKGIFGLTADKDIDKLIEFVKKSY